MLQNFASQPSRPENFEKDWHNRIKELERRVEAIQKPSLEIQNLKCYDSMLGTSASNQKHQITTFTIASNIVKQL